MFYAILKKYAIFPSKSTPPDEVQHPLEPASHQSGKQWRTAALSRRLEGVRDALKGGGHPQTSQNNIRNDSDKVEIFDF